jgi:ECF sigma factor
MAKFLDIARRLRERERDDEPDYQEYLLGGLSSRRRNAIERSSMVEDHVFDSLRAAEEALVQGYVEGGLPADVGKRFESILEKSVEWQRKVRLARTLLSVIPQVKKKVLDEPEVASQPAGTTDGPMFGGIERLTTPGVPSSPEAFLRRGSFPKHEAAINTELFALSGSFVEPSEFTKLFRSPGPKQDPQQLLDEASREHLAVIAKEYFFYEADPGFNVAALLDTARHRLASSGPPVDIGDLASFLVAMARMMRRVLVEKAHTRRTSSSIGSEQSESDRNILAIDGAFADLELTNPRASRAFEMVYFGGLSIEATAAALRVSPRTLRRDLAMTGALISAAIKKGKRQPEP